MILQPELKRKTLRHSLKTLDQLEENAFLINSTKHLFDWWIGVTHSLERLLSRRRFLEGRVLAQMKMSIGNQLFDYPELRGGCAFVEGTWRVALKFSYANSVTVGILGNGKYMISFAKLRCGHFPLYFSYLAVQTTCLLLLISHRPRSGLGSSLVCLLMA